MKKFGAKRSGFGENNLDFGLSALSVKCFLALCALIYVVLLRTKRQDIEAHGFWISQHDIHILHGFARGPFD
jgi:hypothetical protein